MLATTRDPLLFPTLAKRLLRMGVLWFLVGLFHGVLTLWMMRFPDFAQSCGFLHIGRLQLYHGSLLIFGWAFPTLLGVWMLRLQELRQAPLRFLALWEGAHHVWQAALLWAVGYTYFGYHSTWPTWVWMPVIYGCLAGATVLFFLAVFFNRPDHVAWFYPQNQGFLLLLLGLGFLFFFLTTFLIMPGVIQPHLPAFTHALLGLALLLPLLGLWLPASIPHQDSTLPSHADSLFFWFLLGTMVFFPLSGNVLSGYHGASWLWLVAQVAWISAWLLFLRPLMLTWSAQTPPHLLFGKAGAFCLLFFGLEGLIFAGLRTFGHMPSPLWFSTHSHLLLAGTVWLWLHGALLPWLTQSKSSIRRYQNQVWLLLIGLGLLLAGSWLEANLHLHLDQLSLSRGTLFPAGSRTLKLLGGLLLLFPMLRFATLVWQLTRPSPPSQQHPLR